MVLKKYGLLLLLLCGPFSTIEGMEALKDFFKNKSAQVNQPTVKKSLTTLKGNLGTLQTQLTNLHEQLARLHTAITNPAAAQAAAAEKAALEQAAAAQKAAQEQAAQQAAIVDATIAAIAASAASLTKTDSPEAAEYDEVKAHILDQLVAEENRITEEPASASNTGAIDMTPGILLATYGMLRKAINTNNYDNFTSQTQPEPPAYNDLRKLLKDRATYAVELQLNALIQSFNKDTDTYEATKATCIATLTDIEEDLRWAMTRFAVLDESRELLAGLNAGNLPPSSNITNKYVKYIIDYIATLKKIADLEADPKYQAKKQAIATIDTILAIWNNTDNATAKKQAYVTLESPTVDGIIINQQYFTDLSQEKHTRIQALTSKKTNLIAHKDYKKTSDEITNLRKKLNLSRPSLSTPKAVRPTQPNDAAPQEPKTPTYADALELAAKIINAIKNDISPVDIISQTEDAWIASEIKTDLARYKKLFTTQKITTRKLKSEFNRTFDDETVLKSKYLQDWYKAWSFFKQVSQTKETSFTIKRRFDQYSQEFEYIEDDSNSEDEDNNFEDD